MHVRNRRALATTAVGVLLAAGSVGTAYADDVVNNLDASVDTTAEVMSLSVGGAAGSTTLYIQPRPGDGKSGCNFGDGNADGVLTINVASSNTGAATVSPSTVTFDSCGDTQALTVSPVGPGTATVSASLGSNSTAGSFNLVPAAFTVNVAAASTPIVTNTAPVVAVTGFADGATYELGVDTLPTPGCDVQDAEDTNEVGDLEVGALTGPLAAYGLGTVTVTCSYTDGGGLSGEDGGTYTIVDTAVPVITDLGPAPSSPDGKNGWFVSAVTNTFRATDAGAGFETPAPRLPSYEFSGSTGTAEGIGLTVSSGSVTDVAGNTAEPISSAAFDVDLSDPLLNIDGAPDGTSLDLCAAGTPTRPTFDPFDGVSGLDGTLTGDTWTSPTAASGVGTYTYTATATDQAGRSTTETRTFTSEYGSAFAGVQQPINGGATASLADDNSRFKLGSTVPVKFKLVCGTTPVSNAVAKLNVKVADNNPDPGAEEAVSTAASTTGNLFRYDAVAGQYIFNLSTKAGYTNPGGGAVAFGAGTYTLSILLDDGTYRSVNIQLVR